MLAGGTSSGSSVGKNYISGYNSNPCNGDFENGTDSGWRLCQVSSITNGTPSGLTLNAGTVSKSILSVGQIAGQYSLQTIFPSTANQGIITDVFTIDTEDQAKPLTFKFYYQVTSGASGANFSGTSSNTFLVAIYAVNGSNVGWIQPAGVYSMTQATGAGIATGTFQTYSDATQYRFAVLCVNAPSASVTIVFDDFQLGPQVAPIGPVVTDWLTYPATISNFGTVAFQSIKSRRVGDSLEVYGYFQMGTGSASVGTITLGFQGQNSNVTIDSSKLTANATIGWASVNQQTATFFAVSPLWDGSNLIKFGVQTSTANQLSAPATTNNFAASSVITFFAKFPIQGWSSNVQMSNDTDTRIVDLKVNNASSITPSGTIGTSFSTSTNINFNTNPVRDSHGAYSSGIYTVPVSGDYFVSSRTEMSHTSSTGTFVSLSIGVNNIERMTQAIKPATTNAYPFVSGLVTGLNAGDQISVRLFGDPTSKAFVASVINDLTVHRLSGPSVVAASESVTASYYLSATFAASTTIPINFDLKEFDSHNAVTTSATAWKFTAPISGVYEVSTYAYGENPGTSVSFYIYKNQPSVGTATKVINFQKSGANSSGSCLIKLNAGDYIDMRPNQPRNITGAPLNSENCSFMEIKRVGN